MDKKDRELLDWDKAERAADVLRAVAHPVRLKIIELLSGGEMTVTQIQEALGTTQSMTSQQLSLMKSRGILKSRRNGKSVHYCVERPEVVHVINCLKES
ncbi:MAG: metalloregulator ArsR/SmtB family transcription factor [Desulfobacterales bacterium]|nr:metalloregulator ArsR/SmtB family transcription factor [Desulfobacterales bacterium]